jgi:hypothetical protein
MKAYWGSGGIAHAFLTSTLDGGELSASIPDRFTPRERAPGTHCIGGCVGPRVGLDAVVKRKIPSLCRHSNPQSSISYSSAIPLSYPRSRTLCIDVY